MTARREHLAELWLEWSPKKREEVAEILKRLARELIPEAKLRKDQTLDRMSAIKRLGRTQIFYNSY